MSKKIDKNLTPVPSEIIGLLKQDEIKNCSQIGFINNYKITSFKKIKNSIAIKGKSDRDWVYLSCSNDEELKDLLDTIEPSDKCFAAIDDWMMPVFMKRYKLKWRLHVSKFVLKRNIENDYFYKNVSPLKTSDSDYIYSNSKYKDYLSVDYIKERIEKGINAGIHFHDRLAAWAITQDDNAIGFLHVMEEHRGKGYARQIIEYMSAKIKEAGSLPFAYIEETNLPAIKLVQKIGFDQTGVVNWFEIE